MRQEQPWQLLLLMGSGVFIASFWILFGFLSVVGPQAVWWQYPLGVAPGGAMLFLVLMARRAPMPYGSAMILLGGVMTISSIMNGVPPMSASIIGVPLALLGALFMMARRIILTSHT